MSRATGEAERLAAEAMLLLRPDRRQPITQGADKAYEAAEFVATCEAAGVAPHVAGNQSGRRRAPTCAQAQSFLRRDAGATGGARRLLGYDGVAGPGASLLGRGDGSSLTQALGHMTQISLVVFEGREDDRYAKRALGSGRLVQAGVEQALGSGAIRFAVANVEEDEAFLGATGTGAFARRNGARSRLATLGFSAPLGPAELFGAFTAGSTESRPARSSWPA